MIRITSWRRFSGLLGIIVVLGAVGIFWLSRDPRLEQSGTLMIAPGAAAATIWQEAVEAGFTRSSLPWRYHAWRLNAAPRLQAGTYQLDRTETVREVISRFTAGDTIPDERTVTYPEGFTIKQIAARSAQLGLGTAEEFEAATKVEDYAEEFAFLSAIPTSRNLEGYLFPDTYRVADDDTPADLVRRMLATFERRLTEAGVTDEALAESGRTLDEIVIMASIIEREVISDTDLAMVSGVLWKRYDEGIGLAADATVRYALDKWDDPLTVQDLALDSPYNTRKYRGLTPGPISNPGVRALSAALRPQDSDYYYYLSAPDGQTIFSRTNDEHNQNKAKYLQ